MSQNDENPAAGKAARLENSSTAADSSRDNPAQATTQVCREMLRADIAANVGTLQVQIDVALTMLAVPDDVGLLYALRRCAAYWRAIAGSARDLAASLEREGSR